MRRRLAIARSERGVWPVMYSLKRCFCTTLLYPLARAFSPHLAAVVGYEVPHDLEDHYAGLVDVRLRLQRRYPRNALLERGGVQRHDVARTRVQEAQVVRDGAKRVREPMVDFIRSLLHGQVEKLRIALHQLSERIWQPTAQRLDPEHLRGYRRCPWSRQMLQGAQLASLALAALLLR